MDKTRQKIYFGLEMKKGLALIPKFLLMLAVSAAVLALAAAVYCAAAGKAQVLPHLDAAVVSPDEDEMTMQAADIIEHMDSVRSVVSFHFTDKEKAEADFASGKVQAIFYLPENLYDSIYTGENLPVTVKINEDSGLASDLFRELIRSGVSMLQTGESSVYALAAASEQYPLAVSEQDLANSMAYDCIRSILSRSNVWNETFLSPYQNMNVQQYYALSVLMAVTLLFGMSFAVFYSGGERRIRKLLALSGVGAGMQSVSRLAAMTADSWILLAAGYCILSLTGFLPFRPAAFALLLPAAFSMAAFTHLLYSFAGGEGAVFFYVSVTVLLFLLSGGMIPAAVFPDALEKIASALPVYWWEQYLARVLYGGAAARLWQAMAAVLIYAAAMAAVGTGRWKHAES